MVAGIPTRITPLLRVDPGAAPVSADLVVHAGRLRLRPYQKDCFHWQWTTDGGQTFHDAPSTPVGRTTISDLPPVTLVGREGPGEWTPIVTVRVR